MAEKRGRKLALSMCTLAPRIVGRLSESASLTVSLLQCTQDSCPFIPWEKEAVLFPNALEKKQYVSAYCNGQHL